MFTVWFTLMERRRQGRENEEIHSKIGNMK